jgi:5-methylcytosine-specific restriction endonuclease McrA
VLASSRTNIVQETNRENHFDDSDKNIFQVDDARLRADALKHSILPRLHIILNECIALIKEVYDVEALEDSIISQYPNFRQDRDRELSLLYEAAYISLGGKRVKEKWFGIERKDGKPVQIVPFRLGFQLTQEGLGILLENYWIKGLTDESNKKFLDFHLEYEGLTHSLCYACGMAPSLHYGKEIKPISTLSQHYHYMTDNRLFDNDFFSQDQISFPVTSELIDSLIFRYVLFYPIYDSYIHISKGQPVRFSQLLEKANNWLLSLNLDSENESPGQSLSQEILLQAKESAEQRVKVMPAIRWQVFQRDHWRCVSCGRGSQNDAILHVDHINPRSKGGKDVLENYQTLCNICNLGKSNRDNTDLRQRVIN